MMIIPKTACSLCEVAYEYPGPLPIPPVESCPPCETVKEEIILTPIVNTLCPCPLPEPDAILVEPIDEITTVDLCYKEFVLSVATTKFCEIGPKCHSG